MTALTATLFRVVKIGSRRYVLGLHPGATEDVISIRESGRRVGYAVTVSCVRIQAALAYGRSERAAKSAARKTACRGNRRGVCFCRASFRQRLRRDGKAVRCESSESSPARPGSTGRDSLADSQLSAGDAKFPARSLRVLSLHMV